MVTVLCPKQDTLYSSQFGSTHAESPALNENMMTGA